MRPPSLTAVLVVLLGYARGGYLPPPPPPLLPLPLHAVPHSHVHAHGPLTVIRHAPPAVPPYSTQINIFRWLAAFPPPVLHRALLLAQGHLHHPALPHAHLHPVLHHPPPPVLHHPPPVLHHPPPPPPPVLHHPLPPVVHHPPEVHHPPAVFHNTPVVHQTPVGVPPAPVTPVLPSPTPLPAFNGISFSAGPGVALFPAGLPGILRGGFLSHLNPGLRPLTPTFFSSLSPTSPSESPAPLNPTLFSGTPINFPPGFFSPGGPSTTTFEFDGNGNISPTRTPASSPPQTFPPQERPAPLPNNPAGLTFQDLHQTDLPIRQLRPAFAPYRQYLPPTNGITRATSGNLAL